MLCSFFSMDKFTFSIFYAFLWLVTLLPLWFLYLISDVLFVLIYFVFRYRRKVVWENLSKAFPEKSDKEKHHISRRFFRHLCDYFFETIKMMHLSEKHIQKRVAFNDDYLIQKEKEGRNVVGMLGHYANWEWLTAIALKDHYHWVVPYSPLRSSPYFDDFMKGLRQRFGAEPVPMKNTYRRLMEISQSGRLFLAGMIADQGPPTAANRHWLTFLNQDTAVMEGSERIAQKTNAAVFYCQMQKIKRGYYKVTFIPITDKVREENDLFVTGRYFEMLEAQIQEQPEYWLWSHRRWKRQRPDNEKNVKK